MKTLEIRGSRSPGFKTAIAALGALAVIIAACGTDGDTVAPVAPAAPTAVEPGYETSEVEQLVFALAPLPNETNRMWEAVGPTAVIQSEPYRERLLSNDSQTAVATPELAVDWTVSDDFREWTFQLRKGVQWHFGWGEFTSEDVVFSHEQWSREDGLGTQRRAWASAEVTANGPHEVVFRFESPQVGGERLFSASLSEGLIYSSAQFAAEGFNGFDTKPAGTGPYMFKSRAAGESITFERFTEHWSGQVPAFEEIQFRWVPEPSTRLALVLTGEAHVTDIGSELYGQASTAGLTVLSSTTANYQSFLMFGGMGYADHPNNPPVDLSSPWVADARVRGAINKAINREAILEFVYGGRAERLTATGASLLTEGWNPQWEADFNQYYGYDPAAAVRLLAQAGFKPEDIKPKFYAFEFPGSPDFKLFVDAVVSDLAQIGIESEILEVAPAVAREAFTARASSEFLAPFRNTPIRTTQAFFSEILLADSGWGIFNNNDLEGLHQQLRETVDADERERLAGAMLDILFYEWGTIPLAEQGRALVIDPSVIAFWDFPGVTSAGLTHFESIVPAR